MPLPRSVYVLPLYKTLAMPGVIWPQLVANDEQLATLLAIKNNGMPFVGLFGAKQPGDNVNVSKTDDIHDVGVLGVILDILPYSDNRREFLPTTDVYQVMVYPLRRVQLLGPDDSSPNEFRVTIAERPDQLASEDDALLLARSLQIRQLCLDLAKDRNDPGLSLPDNPNEVRHPGSVLSILEQADVKNYGEFADLAISWSHANIPEGQEILAEDNVFNRQTKAIQLLQKKLHGEKMREAMTKTMMEQSQDLHNKHLKTQLLKALQKELGLEQDEKEAIIAKFQARLASLKVPEHAQTVINDEIAKLRMLEPASLEFNTTRTYLDWLTVLPWGVHSTDSLDVARAKTVLAEDHFGIDDLKQQILEFIAVGQLTGSVHGKILCLVGPPGVGKTSVGKSIARALDRKFFRFSVGGMSDVAEIKGHRRTYVGSMPGKLLQCLKLTQTSNPVIMIDEIDKMGHGHHGDPAAALLEVLDPEQNDKFLDHYLDVSYDLSKVLFICTANVLDSIAKPLLDRMEVLRLSGYVLHEKVAIAQKYLIPQAIKDTGLTDTRVSVQTEALRSLINGYCREAGVRNLQKHVEKLFRKVAFEIVSQRAKSAAAAASSSSSSSSEAALPISDPTSSATEEAGVETATTPKKKNSSPTKRITAQKLGKYLGKPQYTSDRFYEHEPAGVVMGLAWTAAGGATLYIETVVDASSKKDHAGLRTTGQMGDVMKESTEIAYTVAKNLLGREIHSNSEFFNTAAIHMHIPEGATKKDGPSAGVTMVTAFLSLALNKPVRNFLAMTGEVSLLGKVLPIGGVKEKTIAARRSGVKTIIFPSDNRKDWDELPSDIKTGFDVHFAENYFPDVFQIAFPDFVKEPVAIESTASEIDGPAGQ